MFLPTQVHSKCATYVRKSIGFAPKIVASYQDYILSVAERINQTPTEFINIYSAGTKETMHFLGNHKPLSNAFLAGDLNIHHYYWYGEAAHSRTGVIRASSSPAEQFIDWAEKFQFTILNLPGTFTHFPRSD